MIIPYFGEFLVNPVPLEMSLNYCSHKCAYCFANLNKPDRRADVKAIIGLLQSFRARETFEARLLAMGYPVVVSNRVDPFAHSNHESAVPLLRMMTALGIPVAIQTRGGLGIDEVLRFLPPSVWYVSVSQLDDAIRRRIEPGAPPIESRFELMRWLKSAGHRIVLGFNPAVRAWLPDPLPLFEHALDCGAEGVWIERLHMNYKQERNLSDRERQALTQVAIDVAKRRYDDDTWEYFMLARKTAHEVGLCVFSIGQPCASEFFRPWRDLYPRTFPVMQDFVNQVAADPTERLVSFDEFVGVMRLPAGDHRWGHAIGATAHQIFRTHRLTNNLTASQFLSLVWNDERIKTCPARIPCFAFAVEKTERDGELVGLTDQNDQAWMVYSPDGFGEHINVDIAALGIKEKGASTWQHQADIGPAAAAVTAESRVGVQ